jgi:hypothetical protein
MLDGKAIFGSSKILRYVIDTENGKRYFEIVKLSCSATGETYIADNSGNQ